MSFNKFCMSSYLAFRYVAKEGIAWKDGVMPLYPLISQRKQIGVRDAGQILEVLRNLMGQICKDQSVGILLSGGIDSGILAALMPLHSRAYTIQFHAENAIDESLRARAYIECYSLRHSIVQVTWEDYLESMDILMLNKKSPLHPVEVGLFKAASTAAADGVRTLIVGNGADSTFGGMDKLLSRDWTFDEFDKRYTFVKPATVLKEPVPISSVYEEYRIDGGVDICKFLKVVHGRGIIQAFNNAISSAGCAIIEPYEYLFLDAPLDIARIRKGESKYLLRSIFQQLYPGLDVCLKIPFARPMDQWMKNWNGPLRSEFLDNLDASEFTGEQKWLIYCLERFMNLFDGKWA